MTVTIQIGNTDGKLTHAQWVLFLTVVNDAIQKRKLPTHFHGFPPATAPWVNACWVVSVPESERVALMADLVMIRKAYKQESVAWTEGITEFV